MKKGCYYSLFLSAIFFYACMEQHSKNSSDKPTAVNVVSDTIKHKKKGYVFDVQVKKLPDSKINININSDLPDSSVFEVNIYRILHTLRGNYDVYVSPFEKLSLINHHAQISCSVLDTGWHNDHKTLREIKFVSASDSVELEMYYFPSEQSVRIRKIIGEKGEQLEGSDNFEAYPGQLDENTLRYEDYVVMNPNYFSS